MRAANQQLSHEITARRQSEEWYRVLVESIHDMIWEVNQEGVFTYASSIARGLLGYTAEEMIGRGCFEFMSPAEQPRHRAVFERGWLPDRVCGMLRFEMQHKDGRRIVHEANFVPVFAADGTCRGFHGVVRDITYRKERKHPCRRTTRNRQAIYDGMVDGLLIADVNSLRLCANQAICRMLGYSEQELVSLSVRDIHPPDELPAVMNRFAALVAGQLVRADNVPMLRKDDRYPCGRDEERAAVPRPSLHHRVLSRQHGTQAGGRGTVPPAPGARTNCSSPRTVTDRSSPTKSMTVSPSCRPATSAVRDVVIMRPMGR